MCVIIPVIVVLSVFLKFDVLSLQSDRLLWRDRTHARMARGSSCGAFVAQLLGVVFRPVFGV